MIVSDLGREFDIVHRVNEAFEHFKTVHCFSTAYTKQTNRLVGRYNQTLQHSLVNLANKEQDNWGWFLDGVLLAYETIPSRDQLSLFPLS